MSRHLRAALTLALLVSAALPMSASLLACKATVKTVRWEVDHTRQPCDLYEMTGMMCLRVSQVHPPQSDRAQWRLIRSRIKGFEPKWGHGYTIEVRQRLVDEPLPDGPPDELELARVVGTRRASPAAQFTLQANNLRAFKTDPTEPKGTLSDGRAFTCAQPAQCQLLRGEREGAVTIAARYGESLEAPLVFTNIKVGP